MLTLNRTERTGSIIGIQVVQEAGEIMLLSLEGIAIRMKVAEISRMGRNTQGVTLMRLDADDKVVAVANIVGREEEPPAQDGEN